MWEYMSEQCPGRRDRDGAEMIEGAINRQRDERPLTVLMGESVSRWSAVGSRRQSEMAKHEEFEAVYLSMFG